MTNKYKKFVWKPNGEEAFAIPGHKLEENRKVIVKDKLSLQ
jgi:hypothetical protein